jgi:transcriptional regulator with XRE-family HTH domain
MASEFGPLLRRLRDSRRLSQAALAERIDGDHSYISRCERGERQPSYRLLAKLAVALALTERERAELLTAALGVAAPQETRTETLARLLADPAVPAEIRRSAEGVIVSLVGWLDAAKAPAA